jgi:hypothetical protein
MARLLKTPAQARIDQYVPPKKKKNQAQSHQDSALLFLESFWREVGSEAYVEGVGSFLLFTQSHRLVLAVL